MCFVAWLVLAWCLGTVHTTYHDTVTHFYDSSRTYTLFVNPVTLPPQYVNNFCNYHTAGRVVRVNSEREYWYLEAALSGFDTPVFIAPESTFHLFRKSEGSCTTWNSPGRINTVPCPTPTTAMVLCARELHRHSSTQRRVRDGSRILTIHTEPLEPSVALENMHAYCAKYVPGSYPLSLHAMEDWEYMTTTVKASLSPTQSTQYLVPLSMTQQEPWRPLVKDSNIPLAVYQQLISDYFKLSMPTDHNPHTTPCVLWNTATDTFQVLTCATNTSNSVRVICEQPADVTASDKQRTFLVQTVSPRIKIIKALFEPLPYGSDICNAKDKVVKVGAFCDGKSKCGVVADVFTLGDPDCTTKANPPDLFVEYTCHNDVTDISTARPVTAKEGGTANIECDYCSNNGGLNEIMGISALDVSATQGKVSTIFDGKAILPSSADILTKVGTKVCSGSPSDTLQMVLDLNSYQYVQYVQVYHPTGTTHCHQKIETGATSKGPWISVSVGGGAYTGSPTTLQVMENTRFLQLTVGTGAKLNIEIVEVKVGGCAASVATPQCTNPPDLLGPSWKASFPSSCSTATIGDRCDAICVTGHTQQTPPYVLCVGPSWGTTVYGQPCSPPAPAPPTPSAAPVPPSQPSPSPKSSCDLDGIWYHPLGPYTLTSIEPEKWKCTKGCSTAFEWTTTGPNSYTVTISVNSAGQATIGVPDCSRLVMPGNEIWVRYNSGCRTQHHLNREFNDDVSGCVGDWDIPGVYNAARHCASDKGWDLCMSDKQVADLGLTASECALAASPNQFFAARQGIFAPTGLLPQCGDPTTVIDDVGGCAGSNWASPTSTNCTVLQHSISTGNAKVTYGWNFSSNLGDNELLAVTHAFATNQGEGGGALCCQVGSSPLPTITIYTAKYEPSKDNTKTCGVGSQVALTDRTTQVKSPCNGFTKCGIPVSSGVLGTNPCVNVDKWLTVQYGCSKEAYPRTTVAKQDDYMILDCTQPVSPPPCKMTGSWYTTTGAPAGTATKISDILFHFTCPGPACASFNLTWVSSLNSFQIGNEPIVGEPTLVNPPRCDLLIWSKALWTRNPNGVNCTGEPPVVPHITWDCTGQRSHEGNCTSLCPPSIGGGPVTSQCFNGEWDLPSGSCTPSAAPSTAAPTIPMVPSTPGPPSSAVPMGTPTTSTPNSVTCPSQMYSVNSTALIGHLVGVYSFSSPAIATRQYRLLPNTLQSKTPSGTTDTTLDIMNIELSTGRITLLKNGSDIVEMYVTPIIGTIIILDTTTSPIVDVNCSFSLNLVVIANSSSGVCATCDVNANCVRQLKCVCKMGFSGNGIVCRERTHQVLDNLIGPRGALLRVIGRPIDRAGKAAASIGSVIAAVAGGGGGVAGAMNAVALFSSCDKEPQDKLLIPLYYLGVLEATYTNALLSMLLPIIVMIIAHGIACLVLIKVKGDKDVALGLARFPTLEYMLFDNFGPPLALCCWGMMTDHTILHQLMGALAIILIYGFGIGSAMITTLYVWRGKLLHSTFEVTPNGNRPDLAKAPKLIAAKLLPNYYWHGDKQAPRFHLRYGYYTSTAMYQRYGWLYVPFRILWLSSQAMVTMLNIPCSSATAAQLALAGILFVVIIGWRPYHCMAYNVITAVLQGLVCVVGIITLMDVHEMNIPATAVWVLYILTFVGLAVLMAYTLFSVFVRVRRINWLQAQDRDSPFTEISDFSTDYEYGSSWKSADSDATN